MASRPSVIARQRSKAPDAAGTVPGERRARKGRGALSNPAGRFEPHQRESGDDGWASSAIASPLPEASPQDEPPPLATEVTLEACRTAITRNDSPDIPFDRSINPYRGCEHGCVYCYARPSHAYMGLSPGLDFETKLFAKPEVAERLRAELARPGYTPAPIALGSNTDPYQPLEKRLGLTRKLLEVLAEARHPVTIVTKGALVTRDIDLLAPLAREGKATVLISIPTLDRPLARLLEPRATTPARRLEAIRALADAGIPTGVLVAPVIPALTDDGIEAVLEASAAAGARMAGWALLRLPNELKQLVEEWLRTHLPDRAEHVLALIRDMRGGALNSADFGRRMRGNGPYAAMLAQRFGLACRRLGLNPRAEPLKGGAGAEASENSIAGTGAWALSVDGFRRPRAPGRAAARPMDQRQLSLL